MKRSHLLVFFLCGLLTMMFLSSCKKDKSESNGFDEEAQRSYEAVIALQNKSMQVFDGFLATQDTAAAKVSLAAWFKTDAIVEWAKVSSQGVMVKYTNGICGGLIIDLQRKKGNLKSLELSKPENAPKPISIKNLPSKKKAVILAAWYHDFEKEVNEEEKQWSYDFTVNDGLPSTELRTNDDVNLDLLTTLNVYGIIDFNTHGLAWPDQVNTEEVYMCSGEETNDETTKKYWNDIKQGTVGIFRKDNYIIYAIRPSFITKYNDFSKDTIMFYGGFCYSALGSWLYIVNSCAAGTYFGFNWNVNSVKCANWAISLVQNLSDHSLATPMTVEQWMSTTPIPKQYWDAWNQKTVKIIYNGYGGLTFWKPDFEMSGEIVSTEADGAPIKTEGYTNWYYILKCSLKGKLPEHLIYEWDYGDGDSWMGYDDSDAFSHQWTEAKSYTVKVKITELFTGKLVKELKTTVSFIKKEKHLAEQAQFDSLKLIVRNHDYLSGRNKSHLLLVYEVLAEAKLLLICPAPLVPTSATS